MIYTDSQLEKINKLTDYHLSVSEKDQIVKAIEELSSLNKLLCKLLLGEIDNYDIELLDELFDTDIMIRSMKQLIVSDDIVKVLFNNVVDVKLKRELERWGIL